MTHLKAALTAVIAMSAVSSVQGVDIQMVTIGNPGNGNDTRYATPGFGGVNYAYQIGVYEVTAAQYVEFLNAVAQTDPFRLYNENMWTQPRGCKIERLGSDGSYSYQVAPDFADRPVNFVSWGDAARFANWMHNGQPSGPEGPGTTEDGSYVMDGAIGTDDLWQFLSVKRGPFATWVIPSESEWYKAAYHKADGSTNHYWDYPTGSDDPPSNDLLDPDPGNSANFRLGASDYTLGDPYWRTVVGEFEHSSSPYGTFDQGGNVSEFNEAILDGVVRCLRGGSWDSLGTSDRLHAQTRMFDPSPTDGGDDVGFRLARLEARCSETDLNFDRQTDLTDLSLLLSHFGSCYADDDFWPLADIDHRGCVDLGDLSSLLAEFGTVCP